MNANNLLYSNSTHDKIKPKQSNSTSNIKKFNLFQSNLQNNDIFSHKQLNHVQINIGQGGNSSHNNYISNSVQNKNLMKRITKDEWSANNDSFQQLKDEAYNLPFNKNQSKEITLDQLRYGNNSFISSMPQTSNSQQINRPLFSKLENLSFNAQAERRTRQNNNLNKNISDTYSAFQSFSNNNLSQINSKQVFELSFESSHLNSDLKLVNEERKDVNSSFNNPNKTIKGTIISPTNDINSIRNKQLNSNKSPLLSSSNKKYKIRPFTQYACITLTDNSLSNKNNLSTTSIDISSKNKINQASIKTISLNSQSANNNHIRNRTLEVKGSNRSLSNSRVVQVETSMELKQSKKFDRKKLFSISIRPLGFILSMLSQEDFMKVFYINSSFKKKILEMLILNIKIIVNDFKTAYRRMLRLDNCILEINRQKEIKINVIFLFSLFNEKLNDTSVAIGYSSKYLCDKESYKNNFRFDIRGKGPLCFWVMREYTNVN